MSHTLILESKTEIKPETVQILETMLKGLGIKIKNSSENSKKSTKKTQAKTSKKAKTTWETSTAPLRDPTPEEAKVIAEFVKNPQILSSEESAKFLQELKMSVL